MGNNLKNSTLLCPITSVGFKVLQISSVGLDSIKGFAYKISLYAFLVTYTSTIYIGVCIQNNRNFTGGNLGTLKSD